MFDSIKNWVHRRESGAKTDVSSTATATKIDDRAERNESAIEVVEAKPRRILFVDGNSTVSQEFRRLLERGSRSWDVAAASNAAEAITLLESEPFDGVVAGARLPDQNGGDFLNTVARRFPALVRLIRYAAEDKHLLRGFLGWPPCH